MILFGWPSLMDALWGCGCYFNGGGFVSKYEISDSDVVRNTRLAVEMELKKKRTLKQPIARFDVKTGQIFLELSDGTIKIVGTAMEHGRYSERALDIE